MKGALEDVYEFTFSKVPDLTSFWGGQRGRSLLGQWLEVEASPGHQGLVSVLRDRIRPF